MNKKNRKIQLEKITKQAELKKLIAQVEEQNGDDNQAAEGRGKKFTDAIIDAFKIPGLED